MEKLKPAVPKRIRKHVNPLSDRTKIVFEGFSDHKPVIVDIGAYKGEFTQSLLEEFGDKYNFIVTEIRKPFARYLRELFISYQNVAVFDGNTASNLHGMLDNSLEQESRVAYMFVNFPDPWFKEKHKKRRVLTAGFLEDLETIFDSQSTLIFQTDQETLFRETQELVNEMVSWQHEEFDAPLWGIQSHWERVKIKEGKEIYRMSISLKNT
jgi:tRNA (guanine-N7-)-methyltransferase